VLLTGYEWRRTAQDVTAMDPGFADTRPATGQDVEHLAAHFEERMDAAGFFYPEHKAHSMKINLRNMWSRFAMTEHDVRMLHGMLRQMVRWKDRGPE